MNRILYLLIIPFLLSNCQPKAPSAPPLSALVLGKSTCLLEQNGRTFRDLNHNGLLDAYEDVNQPIASRVEDLLNQMTVTEKAGLLFINGTSIHPSGSLEKDPEAKGIAARLPIATENIDRRQMTHFNLWQVPADLTILAKWYNNLQSYAEGTRLGIPVTIASDPRHHFSESIFAMEARGFSQFCETLGLAAIGDEALVEAFANIVRQEYLAVGIREALHPQIDLPTEPRWPRISGNFSEDAELTARMARAYISGLQGTTLADGVACMTKHFPGGGPQREGLDPHFEFHKGQIYPGNQFDYHLLPFKAAFEAGTAAIMPYYGVPMGQTDEDVAMAFNKTIITDLLRRQFKYDGIVCTDWGLITDTDMGQTIWPARAWGVEHLSEADRVLKALDAGVDQFGGESRPELVVQLIDKGKLTEERLDTSVRRLLRLKFALGLFDNPFVDESQVSDQIGTAASRALGEQSQQRSMTLLKNEDNVLPLAKQQWKVYVENMDSAIVAQFATIVASPADADFAILRIKTPWYPVETQNPFARGFHHGDLDFKGAEKDHILSVIKTVPTIVDIYLDRPAVIPEIAARSKALIANYGASDHSVCQVLFGNAQPRGNLPFELPSSMDAVRNQQTDVPYDSVDPLFVFGFGLRYAPKK